MKLGMLIVCALSLIASRPQAGSGVAGADILKIPVEARGWGLGTAYSAIADDVGAMAYNPAGLSSSDMREVRLTYMGLFEGTNLWSVLFSFPAGRWATLGGMMIVRTLPTIANQGTDNRPLLGPTSVNASDSVFGLYAAFRFSHLLPGVRIVSPLPIGMGIKQVNMNIAGFKANATATDIGLLLALDTIHLALVGQHLGGGYSFPGALEADALPQTLRIAFAVVAYEDASNSLMLALEDASYIGVSSRQKFGDTIKTVRESLNVLGIGAEYWRLKKMSVRLGYVQPWGSGSNTFTSGRGLALGISFRFFTTRISYQIDAAYRPLSLGSKQQDAVVFSLTLRL